ncbi:hypothetical protein Leryth_018674 [Lithospermum erythrorhizon]|nr:hypothetical protein Leryth_018674 [Lithospermum erythrorhizon]
MQGSRQKLSPAAHLSDVDSHELQDGTRKGVSSSEEFVSRGQDAVTSGSPTSYQARAFSHPPYNALLCPLFYASMKAKQLYESK